MKMLLSGSLCVALIAMTVGCTSEPHENEDMAGESTVDTVANAAATPGESPVAATSDPAVESTDAVVAAAAEAEKAAAAEKAAGAAKLAADAEKTKAAAAAAQPAVKVAMAPPAAFGRCAICHDVTKGGPNKLGPNLYGTYGKAAGVHGGFQYSDALKGVGLRWDDATLDKWLEAPRTLVPGNSMGFPGLKDAAKRKEIIDYLKTLK